MSNSPKGQFFKPLDSLDTGLKAPVAVLGDRLALKRLFPLLLLLLHHCLHRLSVDGHIDNRFI